MRLLIIAAALGQASLSHAADIVMSGKYVDEVGAHTNGNIGFVTLIGGHPDCKYGVIYVDLANHGGRAAYAAALAAKRSGSPMSRVVYVIQADGTCQATLVGG